MKLRQPHEQPRTEITVLPMVNVVFLLLVFFMLVGRIAPSDELSVLPPVSQSKETATGELARLLISADGRMALDGQTLYVTSLSSVVTARLQRDPAVSILLRADGALDADRLIRVMEILRQAGVKELTLQTKGEAQP